MTTAVVPVPVPEAHDVSLDFVTAVLRGADASWPPGATDDDAARFLAIVIDHSVEALALWRLRQDPRFASWPQSIRDDLAHMVRGEALLEAGREGELQALVADLHEAGVPALLFKGAALAYASYPEPWLRPRNDNDILVPPGCVEGADRVLQARGYDKVNALDGELVSYQNAYVRRDRLGFRHVVDLHWKISNRPRIADVLSWDELWREAVDVPKLGPAARGPGRVHALVLACLHTVAHHRNSDNLVWSYDVHLLATGMSEAEHAELVSLARRKHVAAVCASGLRRAAHHFATPVPVAVLEQLDVEGEFSEAFLSAEPWRGDVRLADLRAIDGVSAKLRFMREVAFPSSDYMLREYRSRSRALVPLFHAHRLGRGTWRLMRRFFQ